MRFLIRNHLRTDRERTLKDIGAREAGAAIPAAEFGNGLGRITVPLSPVSSLVFSPAAGHGVPRRPFSLSGTVAGHVG